MKLLCKAENVPSRTITFGPADDVGKQTHYIFEKNDKGHLVCDVEDKEHLGRLLAIPDGYEIYDEASATPVADPPAPTVVRKPRVPKTIAPTPAPAPAKPKGRSLKEINAARKAKK